MIQPLNQVFDLRGLVRFADFLAVMLFQHVRQLHEKFRRVHAHIPQQQIPRDRIGHEPAVKLPARQNRRRLKRAEQPFEKRHRLPVKRLLHAGGQHEPEHAQFNAAKRREQPKNFAGGRIGIAQLRPRQNAAFHDEIEQLLEAVGQAMLKHMRREGRRKAVGQHVHEFIRRIRMPDGQVDDPLNHRVAVFNRKLLHAG